MLWPVVHDGRLERLGYIFLGSWFLEQLRHEAGVYIDWDVLRDLPPIARKLYGLLENDRFEEGEEGEEWQAYWLGPGLLRERRLHLRRERDNVAALLRACEAIAGHPGTGYRFTPRAGRHRRGLGPAAAGLRPGRQRRAAGARAGSPRAAG